MKNLFILWIWVLFVLIVMGKYGKVLGIPFLFLDPEYLGSVNFWSFLLIGLSFGAFVTAFNITCYILYSTRFLFVGLLSKPFSKFSLNNSIIPLLALAVYVINIISFQIQNGSTSVLNIASMLSGLFVGIFLMIVMLYAYFRITNKNIFGYLTEKMDSGLKKVNISRSKALEKLKESKTEQINVRSYFDFYLRLQKTNELPDVKNKVDILRVFDQNHFNSAVLQIMIVAMILILRYFMDSPQFQIPAGASVLLVATVVVMLVGAATYWFRNWSIAVVVGIFLTINGLMKTGIIDDTYKTPGMIYENEPIYSLKSIRAVNADSILQEDRDRTLEILNNWRQKFPENQKPKMVFICVSGGGQRAALWTFNSLKHLDDLFDYQLMKHTMLITGASGGIIGASYFRELAYRRDQGIIQSLNDPRYIDNISKDNLNPIIFSMVVNDLVLKNQTFTYQGRQYLKDRGVAFENQLNRNTNFVLDKKMIEYRDIEYRSDIPMLMMSPSISLDARKLYLSPQSVSYMSIGQIHGDDPKYSGIDFYRFFKNNGAADLKFMTALRLNASFPYITPNVTLPSDPPIEIMDAGVADNYGIADALRFLFVFKTWIEKNTGGIVLLSIRDNVKEKEIKGNRNLSIIERFSVPISSVYNNLTNQQEINNDDKINSALEWFDAPMDVVTIAYNTGSIFQDADFNSETKAIQQHEIERASLSWHLTKKEKQNLLLHIENPKNVEAMTRMKTLVLDIDTRLR